jgi:hypothetical protein
MASFTKLDDNNIVLAVISVHDNELLDENGNESEQQGIDFLTQWSGGYTKWKQTSFNTIGGVHSNGGTPFRKNYAAVGYTYDEQRDAFIPPKPFASWSLNENSCQWQPPVAIPADSNRYFWNEETQTWVEVNG